MKLLVSASRKRQGYRWIYQSYRRIGNATSAESKPLSAASLKLREGGPARTRFAPSPTGYLHLGSLRTALFNYVIAKATGGQFILRIEDTDQTRTKEDAEQRLFEDLEWAGLRWDEGPGVGGPYGPYKQSGRLGLYKTHVDDLLNSGHAYRCFCTPERLHELAQYREKLGQPPTYDRACAHIHKDHSAEKAAHGEAHVVRLKSPEKYPAYKDLIFKDVRPRIELAINLSQGTRGSFDDPIILKTDGFPTYHLANVVDDHLMKITHVIRGSEWLSSTPKHIFMYEAFGWEPPKFGHVSLLTDLNGQKLSKRTGSIDIRSMREEMGVFPETVTNFVALLGWSHTQKSDVMSLEDLVRNASLKFTKGDTVVAMEKMWFLQKKHAARYALASLEVLPADANHDLQELAVKPILKCLKNRIEEGAEMAFYAGLSPEKQEHLTSSLVMVDAQNYTSANEFIDRNITFFSPPSDNMLASEPCPLDGQYFAFSDVLRALEALQVIPSSDWTASTIKSVTSTIAQGLTLPEKSKLRNALSRKEDVGKFLAEYKKLWMKSIYGCLRWAIAAGRQGPDGSLTMSLLGKEETIRRLNFAKRKLLAEPESFDTPSNTFGATEDKHFGSTQWFSQLSKLEDALRSTATGDHYLSELEKSTDTVKSGPSSVQRGSGGQQRRSYSTGNSTKGFQNRGNYQFQVGSQSRGSVSPRGNFKSRGSDRPCENTEPNGDFHTSCESPHKRNLTAHVSNSEGGSTQNDFRIRTSFTPTREDNQPRGNFNTSRGKYQPQDFSSIRCSQRRISYTPREVSQPKENRTSSMSNYHSRGDFKPRDSLNPSQQKSSRNTKQEHWPESNWRPVDNSFQSAMKAYAERHAGREADGGDKYVPTEARVWSTRGSGGENDDLRLKGRFRKRGSCLGSRESTSRDGGYPRTVEEFGGVRFIRSSGIEQRDGLVRS